MCCTSTLDCSWISLDVLECCHTHNWFKFPWAEWILTDCVSPGFVQVVSPMLGWFPLSSFHVIWSPSGVTRGPSVVSEACGWWALPRTTSFFAHCWHKMHHDNALVFDPYYTANVVCLPGLGNDDLAGRMGQLESFEPDTKEDFDKFGNLLRDKITKYDVSYLFVGE